MITTAQRRECVLSWLDSLKAAKTFLDVSAEVLEAYRSKLEVTARAYDAAPGQMNPDEMAERVARLIELRESWEFDVVRLSEELDEGRRIMAKTQERRWLWEHYVERKRWGEIAQREHYAPSAVRMACRRHAPEVYDDLPGRWRIG